MSKMKTTDEFKQEVKDIVQDEYEVLGEYTGTNKPILMKHNLCGHEWQVTPNNFLNGGTRCPKHTNSRIRKSKTKTPNEFKQEVRDITKGEYEVLDTYIDSQTPITFKHMVCGSIFTSKPSIFLRTEKRCPKCSTDRSRLRKTTEQVRKEVLEKFGEEFIVLGPYQGSNKPIRIYHNIGENSHEFNIIYNNFMKRGRCNICNKPHKPKDPVLFEREVKIKYGSDYKILTPYKDNKQAIKIKHVTCGNVYDIRPVDLLHPNVRGKSKEVRLCPYCTITSEGENDLYEFLKHLLPDMKIIRNDRSILEGRELDIYIPDKNIAIEFNGLYWHSEEMLNGDKNYHLHKTLTCQEKGIRLIHIFENEWTEKQEIVKKKLTHILGENTSKKVYARNCYIMDISAQEKKEFLNKNHIQGNDSSSIYLGLYENTTDDLVSVITFGKPRLSLGQKKPHNSYELIRFASDIDKIVVGGFGKLFKYFVRTYKFEKIITYADLRWSNGLIYEKTGFKKTHISKPTYWYFHNDNKLLHRYSFRKQRLKTLFPDSYHEDKTEYEIMLENGYKRIWDCGNLVYVYKN